MAGEITVWVHLLVSKLTGPRVAAIRAKHEARLRGNLSITRNVANTEALVKISGCDPDWLSLTIVAHAIRIYLEADRRDFWPIFYTAAWQAPDLPP